MHRITKNELKRRQPSVKPLLLKARGAVPPQPQRNTVATAVSSLALENITSLSVLEHIASCVMVDTVGISLDCVTLKRKPKRFGYLDDDDAPILDSAWGKGALSSAAGKQSVRVRTSKSSAEGCEPSLQTLTAEGSPAGHRQGHNIVSDANVTALTYDMLRAINEKYGVMAPFSRKLAIARGCDVEITRIDPVLMLKCPPELKKSAVINGLALAGIASGCDIGLYHGESVYFDQSSQLNSTKLYDKTKEMQSKRKFAVPDSPNWAALLKLADETIRMEAVFRKKHFMNHADFKGKPIHPLLLTRERLASMMVEALSGYNLKASLRGFLLEDELYAVPLPYRTTLALFQHGRNVRRFLGSERTYQAHAKFLWDNYGVNINGMPPGEIELSVDIGEILDPRNFVPVPEVIANDPALFFRDDLESTIQWLREKAGSGIASVFVDPYRPSKDDEV